MRIVVDLQSCQNSSRHRGIGRYSFAIVKAMMRSGRGHEFIIVLNEAFSGTIGEIRKEFGGLLNQDAFAVFSVPSAATAADPASAWRNRAAELSRAHFIESLSPDIVFIPSLFEGFWDDTIVSVERERRHLTAVTLYDLIPLEDLTHYLGGEHDRAAYLRRLDDLRQADLVLPISNYVARDAIARVNLSPEKVVVAYCGVDKHFAPNSATRIEKANWLSVHGITRPYVLTVSPLERRKNIEGLIAGFASMSREIRDAHQLVFSGRLDSAARGYITDLAKVEGLCEDAIVFLGFVTDGDLSALYHYSSVFAFPSFNEGFGLPLLEAMACGAPVVGSDRTSIPEVVGRNDLLCDPSNVKSIARTIQRILADPDLQQELREFGPKRASTFSWQSSAEVVLSAFKTLYERSRAFNSSRSETVRAAVHGDLAAAMRYTTLAYVVSTTSPETRLAGVNNGLAAALAESFNVTIVDNSITSYDDWVMANCTVRDFDWFDQNSEKFEYVIYVLDYLADAAVRQLMSRHKGDVLLINRLSTAACAMLVGPNLFDGAQLALFEQGGIAALAAATDGSATVEQVVTLLHQDIATRADQIIIEADTCFWSAESRIGVIPSKLSTAMRQSFRSRLGVTDACELVVVITTDDRSANNVLSYARKSPAEEQANRRIVLFSNDQETGIPFEAKWGFGGVCRLYGELDSFYRGLLSAADVIILDEALPDHLKTCLRADLDISRVVWVGGEGQVDVFSSMCIGIDKKESAVEPREVDITGTAKTRSTAVALQKLLRRSRGCPLDEALRDLVRRIPLEVRGVQPDGNDLAHLASSVAYNEARLKPKNIYVDVTAFAGRSPRRRVDLSSRLWLSAFFQQTKYRVRAVYAEDDCFMTADRFAAEVCGVTNRVFRDQRVIVKPGDRLVGVDIFASFEGPNQDARIIGQERGLSVGYIVLGARSIEHGDLLPSFAATILTWIDEIELTTDSWISALPPSEVGYGTSRKQQSRFDQITSTTSGGLGVSVLLCDGMVDAELGKKIRLRELSATVLRAYRAWDACRRDSAAADRHQTAADFGHVIKGHLLGSYSLAIINRSLARALDEQFPCQVRYLPVETVPINHTEGVPVSDKQLIIDLIARPPLSGKEEILISHHYPVIAPEGNYRLSLALFFWEETLVPLETVQLLNNNFDAVISPAGTVTKALLDSGLAVPIATIGQPVDIEPFDGIFQSREVRASGTTFLHVSSCFKRKGADVLIEAWARAFTSRDNVRLVIKTFPNPHNEIMEQVSALRSKYPDLASIEIINCDITQDEIVKIYARADVMVLPSRGEGYNLPALEAMIAGVPLIVTGHGGHRDFCGSAEARLLRYDFATSHSHVGSGHSMWVEPDLDDLVAALQEQVDPDYRQLIDGRRDRARTAAAYESNKAEWLRRYNIVIGGLLKPGYLEPVSIAWVSTWGVQCGIAQYSSHLLENFSSITTSNLVVICDTRTSLDVDTFIALDPSWDVAGIGKVDRILDSVFNSRAEAIVIQHQDGLISWKQLGQLVHDTRLIRTAIIVILHNAGNMLRAEANERRTMLEGLSKISRVLVHNIADLNLLSSLGLSRNVGLLPHGAYAANSAPWPRMLSYADSPVIGCHGFFFRHKGIDKLIRAVAILRQEWPHLRLKLVNARYPGEGHDEYIHECKRLAVDLGISDHIDWYQEFLPLEEINMLLVDCDVLVLPYDESDDSASGAVRVCMSSMVPLVATKVKIFAELGEAAVWAVDNVPQSLAGVVAPLLRSPERRREAQAAMHEWLIKHDWKKVGLMLEGMIQGLVKQKRLGWELEHRSKTSDVDVDCVQT